ETRSSTTRKRPSRGTTAATVRSVGSTIAGSDSELAELDLDFAGVPDLVEHPAVDPRDRRLVGVGDAFPAAGLQAIDEGGLVGDAAGLGVRAQDLADVPELDVGVKQAPQVNEGIAVIDADGGGGD